MNVLYLTNNAGRASTTVATRGWLEAFMPRGLRPVVISAIDGEFQQWVERRGGDFYRLLLPFPSKTRPWAFARALWTLHGIVRRHHITLVHCNEQDVYPVGAWLARLCRLPIIVSVHSALERGFCEWAFGGYRVPDRMIFISRASQDACRGAVDGIVSEDRWLVLPNGLDLSHYRVDDERRRRFRNARGLTDQVAVGVACATRPGKQLEHLFEALARLHDLPVQLFLAGGPVPGDEDYSAALIETGRRLLGQRFTFLGYLDDLRDLLNGLDVFVNTSRAEACSISVLEAMACGCPVLGYPSVSVAEQVLPGGGEIVPQDDVGRLADTLREWVVERQALAERRAGARRRVEEDYDISKLSGRLWSEYVALTGRAPSL